MWGLAIMKTFIKSKIGKLCVAVLAAALLLGGAFGGYQYWLYQQPKFQNVTIELGTASLGIDQFVTQYASLGKCRFVSDVSTLDIGKPGVHKLTLRHGNQEQTVTLTVVDTTAPEVVFITERTEQPGYIPAAEDFVESCSDLSGTHISFAAPVKIEDFSDRSFTVIVADDFGNVTESRCSLSYQWLKESYQLEYGTAITKEDLLLVQDTDGTLIDPMVIDALNGVGIGTYTVKSTSGNATRSCTVTIADTQGPVLELQTVSVFTGKAATKEDFIVNVSDPSGVKEVRMLTELDFETKGVQTVVFEAEDTLGNISTAQAEFIVSTDVNPPVIKGLTTLKVNKNDKPDYLIGVSATDAIDGKCAVRYDASAVDTSKSGTYYVTYYATDKSNNKAVARRKVEVLHDAADTAALVAELAPKLSSDPEALRDYVRNNIGYSHDWGGSDPVWFGFKNKHGNCYVHAMCLDVLLKHYGYSTQLIWTSCKTHYWLLINIGGTWRHIDPTPSSVHSIYSLMTDAQRKSTLSGRDWDRDQWPKCE